MAGQGSLDGKVAIVSGASRGVGRAYALALAGAGARVMALARSAAGDPAVPGSLAELAATAAAHGAVLRTMACDVADTAAVAGAVAATVAAFGGVDVLVNNAVWPIAALPALSVDEAEWQGAFRVNVQAPYLFMRAALPSMAGRGGGSVVNITSGAAGQTRPGSPAHGYPAYAVSKAALERLTTYFAAEYEGRDVAVNAVSPGHVGWYTSEGQEPDEVYWGAPLVFLAAQRPRAGGLTGRILHTYGFGTAWGPARPAPQALRIVEMLRRFG